MNLKSSLCVFADFLTVTDKHDRFVPFKQQQESAPYNSSVSFP
jgi:hypothetical protein